MSYPYTKSTPRKPFLFKYLDKQKVLHFLSCSTNRQQFFHGKLFLINIDWLSIREFSVFQANDNLARQASHINTLPHTKHSLEKGHRPTWVIYQGLCEYFYQDLHNGFVEQCE